jgi:hypothetical protein
MPAARAAAPASSAATRDYKARRARQLDARRVRDFGAGAAAGIALTAAAFLLTGAWVHRLAATAPAADPAVLHPLAGAPAPGAAAVPPEPTFGEILTHPEVQMPRQEQALAGAAAKVHRR